MLGESAILETLFPGPERQLLCAFFGEPERWRSLGELVRRTGMEPGELRRHMVRLRDCGLIEGRPQEGRVWFRARRECPVCGELQSLFTRLMQARTRETILVVEDQPATARITRILLESWGYEVLEARGGDEAIGVFEAHAYRIHLLLTDVIMPGISGYQLADELLRRKPGLPVVFMSGYPKDELAGRSVAFLAKPFNPASLSRMVRRELDRAALARMKVR